MTQIEKFRKVMIEGMKENFETTGYLVPIAFFLLKIDNEYQPHFMEINGKFLSNSEYKKDLASKITEICQNPMVLAAGVLTEAYGVRIPTDSELIDKVTSSELSISQLDEKEELIVMTFSTPVKQEIIAYVVDANNKTIGEQYSQVDNFEGVFSGFFGWNRN